MNYKLLVTDIDGTLAGADGRISDANLAALRRIHRAGVGISLCTGRAACGCRHFLEQLGMPGHHIFFDGALITDSTLQENIYSKAIATKLLAQVCAISFSAKLALELFSASSFYVNKQNRFTEIHSDLLDTPAETTDLLKVIEDESIILGCLVVPLDDVPSTVALFDPIQENLTISPTFHPAYPEVRLINITAKDVSKGTALDALVAYLGLNHEEVIAFGDGVNDIPLLRHAGTSVAMGNAPNEVKNIADHVTGDISNNGLAQAVERYFPV